MIGFLAATPAERRLIPGGRLQGPTPYVIAIMMFVMVVIGAAGLALGSSARLVAAGVDNQPDKSVPSPRRESRRTASAQRCPRC